jgi:hypothetical protein
MDSTESLMAVITANEYHNGLIAEFMGASFNDEGTARVCGRFGLETVSASDLEYHRSWDWLMPVVERIESDERYDVDILQYGTRIIERTKTESIEIVNNIANISFDKKIEHTYQAIVDFVKQQ